MRQLYDTELDLERDSFNEVITKVEHRRESCLDTSSMSPESLAIRKTIGPLSVSIEQWLVPTPGRGGSTKKWLRVLNLKPHEVAYIVLKSLLGSVSGKEDRALVSHARSVVKHLYAEARYRAFVSAGKHEPRLKAYRLAVEKNLELTNKASRKTKVILRAAELEGITGDLPDLLPNQEALLGTNLIDLAIGATGFFEKVGGRKRTTTKLRLTPALTEWIKQVEPELAKLLCTFKPMVVRPLPWRGMKDGGYLCHPRPYRFITGWRNNVVEPEPQVFRAVNAIQDTPWRINRFIYDLQRDIWERDLAIAGVPARHSREASKERLPDDIFNAMSPDERRQWKKARTAAYQQEARDRGEQVMQAMRLAVAAEFRDYEQLWFPHCIDFRGRVYPIPSVLSPQGNDLSKSLLEFGEPGTLDDTNIKWLKIHIANCWGEDKCSFEDRVAWVDSQSVGPDSPIFQSVVNPIETAWWTEADKPFTFLAACNELVNYCWQGSTETRIPIAQDGTCSGLQHYGALLRDVFGGEATNLTPSDKPQDIYRIVADKAESILEETLQQATEATDETHWASVWRGKVDRKVTKRNVMTTPYGVTPFGAADQIEQAIKDGDAKIVTDDNTKAAVYLAAVIRQALRHVVVSAAEGMDWLRVCAHKITTETGQDPQWVTPVGMCVIHSYRRNEYTEIQTLLGGTRLTLSVAKGQAEVNPARNALAIAPNVIHSLDASHLMLTVLEAQERDIKHFALVHDSFGTTADKTKELRQVLKETFVDLYKGNWFQHLKAQWEGTHKIKLPDPPPQGDLDLNLVFQSDYIFN